MVDGWTKDRIVVLFARTVHAAYCTGHCFFHGCLVLVFPRDSPGITRVLQEPTEITPGARSGRYWSKNRLHQCKSGTGTRSFFASIAQVRAGICFAINIKPSPSHRNTRHKAQSTLERVEARG